MRAYRSLIYAILTAGLIAVGSSAAGFLLGSGLITSNTR